MTTNSLDRPTPIGPLERLAQLAAVYDTAEADAKAAAERLDALKAAVKAELYQLGIAENTDTGVVHAEYASPALRAPWVLDYRTTDKIDTKALRVAHPVLAEQYTRTSDAWYLTRGKKN
jgi:hypothetical protein